MRVLILCLSAWLLAGVALGQTKKPAATATKPAQKTTPAATAIKKPSQTITKMDSLSYSLGVLVGQNLKQQGFENIDAATLAKAMQDVLKGDTLKLDVAQCSQIVQTYAMGKQAEMQALEAKKYEANISAGKQFLDENGKRSGVTTLPSGLQYEVLTAGTGPQPTANDKVTVHYTGSLLDGTVFDSSVERGEPATFGVTQVIQGWVEALQLMPQGSKWKLYIPYNLAYGERGAGDDIKPYSTLVFEVELLKIN
jgi:FKBP-type peptidyl-prolyl cis-trans isomerase FklB